MKKKLYAYIALTIMSFLLVACHDTSILVTPQISPSASARNIKYNDIGFNKSVKNPSMIEDTIPMAGFDDGIGINICKQNGESFDSCHIRYQDSNMFFLSFYNYIGQSVEYKLIQITDFVKTNVVVDEKEYEAFDFNMPAYSYINIPISLNVDDKSIHDILFIFAADIRNKSLDEEYRLNTEMYHYKDYRLFILPNKPDDGNNFGIQYIKPAKVKTSKQGSLILNKSENDSTLWLTDTVKPGTTIPCYIHIGNGDNKQVGKFALLLLNEWEQAEISPGVKTVYVEIDQGMEAVIPTIVQMPDTEGIYDITPILIPSPYEITYNETLSPAIRTGIQVISDP